MSWGRGWNAGRGMSNNAANARDSGYVPLSELRTWGLKRLTDWMSCGDPKTARAIENALDATGEKDKKRLLLGSRYWKGAIDDLTSGERHHVGGAGHGGFRWEEFYQPKDIDKRLVALMESGKFFTKDAESGTGWMNANIDPWGQLQDWSQLHK